MTTLVAPVARGGMEELRGRIHEAVARHEPLEFVLTALASGAEELLPGARVAVFQLADGRLRAHGSSAGRCGFLRNLDGLTVEGPGAAPWWALRGTQAILNRRAEQAPLLEWEGCWSDLLITSAGEVVGTLTLFLAPGESHLEGEGHTLNELKSLAALALEQHHLLEELYFLAQRDPLTGVWNRTQLERMLDQALAEPGSRVSVVWLELSGFDRVNSILGSWIGDAVLREAADRLRGAIRPADRLARVGGDEFAVMVAGLSAESETSTVAVRLQAVLTRPFEIQGHCIQLAATAGISHGGTVEDQADLVLRRARMAMECAQHRAPGTLACFEPAMHSKSRDRLALEDLIRKALLREELLLHYQPQFCLRSGRLAGCEALVRWRQPEIGLVSPATFIPIAEELGLIGELGLWVLGEACRQGQIWERQGNAVRVGVNVSPHQLRAGTLAGDVEATLLATGLAPERLELEITESAVLENVGVALAQMHRIQELGVTFALDDFGTGQSSLAWLRDLPVQRLKIDRGFLQELENGPRAPILQSIIGLAHELSLSVIIEGIETEEQLSRVRALGCDEVQGFLRGRPVEPGRFAELYLTPPPL